jgi:hypothetical protein
MTKPVKFFYSHGVINRAVTSAVPCLCLDRVQLLVFGPCSVACV